MFHLNYWRPILKGITVSCVAGEFDRSSYFYHHLIKNDNLCCLNKLGCRDLYQIQFSEKYKKTTPQLYCELYYFKGSFKKYVRWKGRRAVIEKRTKMNRGVLACVYVRFFKKNPEIFKMKSIVIFQFFILIIMAVWNIKRTIVKDSVLLMNGVRSRLPALFTM